MNIVFSPKASYFAADEDNGDWRIYETQTCKVVGRLHGISSVAFANESPDLVLQSNNGKTVLMENGATGMRGVMY